MDKWNTCKKGFKLVRNGTKWVCRRIGLGYLANTMNKHNTLLNFGIELADLEDAILRGEHTLSFREQVFSSPADAQRVLQELYIQLEKDDFNDVEGAKESYIAFLERRHELNLARNEAASAAAAAAEAAATSEASAAAAAAAARESDPVLRAADERAAAEARAAAVLREQHSVTNATAHVEAARARIAASIAEINTTRAKCEEHRQIHNSMIDLLGHLPYIYSSKSDIFKTQVKTLTETQELAANGIHECNARILLLLTRQTQENFALQRAHGELLVAQQRLDTATAARAQNVQAAAAAALRNAEVAAVTSFLAETGAPPRRRRPSSPPPRGGSRKRRIQRKQRKTRRS